MGPSITAYRDRYVTYVNEYAKYAYLVLRIGLGLVIFLAGAHKLVAPEVWTTYAAPWVTTLWPDRLVEFEIVMMLNGVFELLFGVALIAGIYTTVTAGIITLSLGAVVVDLLSGAVMTGKFVDILIRDIGLFALATGVTALSAEREAST